MNSQFRPTMGELTSLLISGISYTDIIASTPRYLGASAMVPSEGSRHTTPATNDMHVLFRAKNGKIRAMLNSCPHRNNELIPVGKIVDGCKRTRAGNVARNGNIICPFHQYTFNQEGALVAAPAFSQSKDKQPCIALNMVKTEQVGGLIFEAGKGAAQMLSDVYQSKSLAKLGIIPFDFSDMTFHSIDESNEKFSALTAMEVFGDTDHVDNIHKDSFNQLIDMGNLWLERGEHWNIQFVGWREKTTKICAEYQCYRDAVLVQGNIPQYGAVWMIFGPYTTFEWYPTDMPNEHVFVVSTFVPDQGGGCRNVVEWYAPNALLARNPELVTALKSAYAVTAEEDRELCNSTEQGRRTLVENGCAHQKLGPTHPLQEGCVDYYYEMIKGYIASIKHGNEHVQKLSAVA